MKHQLVVPQMPLTGDLASDLGMYPELELNWQPFSLWDDAQITELHQSGQITMNLK